MRRNITFTELGLSFLDKTNAIVTTLTAIFLLYTRSAGVAWFVAGASTSSLSVKLIKRSIRQPRPPHALQRKLKGSYGMPSTHSATITFFAIYILLASRYLTIHKTLPQEYAILMRTLPSLITMPWAIVILMSRVWLGYHTWEQVGVGACYGCLLALAWFSLWTKYEVNLIGIEVERTIWNWFGW